MFDKGTQKIIFQGMQVPLSFFLLPAKQQFIRGVRIMSFSICQDAFVLDIYSLLSIEGLGDPAHEQ